MKTVLSPLSSPGFTLVEVLISLGLCALLAVAAASAVQFSWRAAQLAERAGEASLLLPTLYCHQRQPNRSAPALPSGWNLETSTDIRRDADDFPIRWQLLYLRDDSGVLAPLSLRILDESS